ncbi:single-strand DNA-binding protein [Marchantia polymorpha subsp. ruderalis]|uniref:Uncharacterized protein n=2 Tax=Marchantia polymorpha TaxID=3197 RepID=A0AAF6BF25_MARPO|nr:hypothetical protein MARPO_0027s0128 [Marchantia polymorpha]BBN10609.1 hypothetical protein Mp_5g04990 [Marchantia polymorpha subsp. ruderalis]|eukprot:PTQ43026.1 hypothetical protein MARPO_0027s0128 [Marchantia polymorpha]
MASLGRTAGFCCCRCSPAVHSVFNSSGRVCAPPGQSRAVSASGFALLKALSSKLSAQQGSCKAVDSFSAKSTLSRVSFNLRSAAARAYYSESGFQYGRTSAPSEQYGQTEQDRDQFPRPPLIPWEKDLANAVQLIGNVGKDLDIKYLDTGKIVAKSSLAVKKPSQKNEEPSWFELEFWDELAEIAAHHVKKGDQIFVTGRIIVDKAVTPEATYTRVKVSVSNLCFVEPFSGQRRAYVQPNSSQNDEFVDTSDNNWSREVISAAAPQQNWNTQSVSPQQQSSSPVAGTAGKASFEDESLSTEKRWQAFFADPSQWWDNRFNKKNPKAPDFKHKSTQEVLWLNSWNNPPWVAAQVAAWEDKQAQTGEVRGAGQRSNRKNLSSFKDSDLI